ncbi:MAG TPA: DNA cytosine methyltransferase, partial [Longimicrobium sp.]|nr:DNA cytosine methyltransferase [Longimicrobium sp.]
VHRAAGTRGRAADGPTRHVDGIAIYVDIRFRMLTNREFARAMSFEDGEYEYHFTGTEEEQTRQIGNAVPVRTARALCGAIVRR